MYRTQDNNLFMMMCSLCQLGWFLLGHAYTFVTGPVKINHVSANYTKLAIFLLISSILNVILYSRFSL